MFSPETVILWSGRIWLCHYGKADIRWELRPRTERWNPLRYEIGFRTVRGGPVRFRINRKGKWERALSNFTWRLWRKRAWQRQQEAKRMETGQ